MKQNIAFVSLNNQFSKKIGKNIADKLELFFVDIDDMLQYNLVDKNMMLRSGKEYFDKQEKKVVESISSFQNILIVANFETFSNANHIATIGKNATIIYLKFAKKQLAKVFGDILGQNQGYASAEEDKYIRKYADIVVCVNDEKDIENKILQSISKYFERGKR